MSALPSGKSIWVTRPAHQALDWADRIAAAGGTPLCEPLLAIDPPADPATARAALTRATTADIVIASSVNAVDHAWRLWPEFVPGGALFAVGAASARALALACGRPVAQPEDCFSSEHLLALDALCDCAGQRVALLAGEGGRMTLADTLSARGAQVEKIALYRRRPCAIAAARLQHLLAASDAVVVTSAQALVQLECLMAAADPGDCRRALERCVLVAPSSRVVKQGNQRLSWTRAPVIVDRVSGDAVVAALARVWRGNGQ